MNYTINDLSSIDILKIVAATKKMPNRSQVYYL